MKINDYLDKKLAETTANVCRWSDRSCLTCKFFDPNYHKGYCDYHRVDTEPSKYCSDWTRG